MVVIMGSTAISIGTLVSGNLNEFAAVVRQEMGRKWSNFLAFIGGILTTLVASIFFLLACEVLYDVFHQFSRNDYVNGSIDLVPGQAFLQSHLAVPVSADLATEQSGAGGQAQLHRVDYDLGLSHHHLRFLRRKYPPHRGQSIREEGIQYQQYPVLAGRPGLFLPVPSHSRRSRKGKQR